MRRGAAGGVAAARGEASPVAAAAAEEDPLHPLASPRERPGAAPPALAAERGSLRGAGPGRGPHGPMGSGGGSWRRAAGHRRETRSPGAARSWAAGPCRLPHPITGLGVRGGTRRWRPGGYPRGPPSAPSLEGGGSAEGTGAAHVGLEAAGRGAGDVGGAPRQRPAPPAGSDRGASVQRDSASALSQIAAVRAVFALHRG